MRNNIRGTHHNGQSCIRTCACIYWRVLVYRLVGFCCRFWKKCPKKHPIFCVKMCVYKDKFVCWWVVKYSKARCGVIWTKLFYLMGKLSNNNNNKFNKVSSFQRRILSLFEYSRSLVFRLFFKWQYKFFLFILARFSFVKDKSTHSRYIKIVVRRY